jgi:hypothetical protein
MINSETPYKLAEIIRDTWPQLYIQENSRYNIQNDQDNERVLDSKRQNNG